MAVKCSLTCFYFLCEERSVRPGLIFIEIVQFDFVLPMFCEAFFKFDHGSVILSDLMGSLFPFMTQENEQHKK